MELKEMEGVAIRLDTESEFYECRELCINGGWIFNHQIGWFNGLDQDFYITCSKHTLYGKASKVEKTDTKLITLAEFKKEQGIMKYKEGDVLANASTERKILGVCGNVYFPSKCNNFDNAHGEVWTEQQLDYAGYTLKTDEPELTTLTMEDVAKLAGIGVDSLRIEK